MSFTHGFRWYGGGGRTPQLHDNCTTPPLLLPRKHASQVWTWVSRKKSSKAFLLKKSFWPDINGRVYPILGVLPSGE